MSRPRPTHDCSGCLKPTICGPGFWARTPSAAGCYFWPRRERCPVTAVPWSTVTSTQKVSCSPGRSCTSHESGSISFGDSGGYGVGQVDLPEGLRIQAPLVGTHEDWQIGGRWRSTTFPWDRTMTEPASRPVRGAAEWQRD